MCLLVDRLTRTHKHSKLTKVVARESGPGLKHRPSLSCYRHDLKLSALQARKPVMSCKLTLICKLTFFLKPHSVLCTQTRISCIYLQTSQALHPKKPPPQNCIAHDALRATSWGSRILLCTKATHSPPASIHQCLRLRDGDIATGDVHVPGIDGTCARVAASLNRCLCLFPNPKQLPISPKPETLYSSRYTRV